MKVHPPTEKHAVTDIDVQLFLEHTHAHTHSGVWQHGRDNTAHMGSCFGECVSRNVCDLRAGISVCDKMRGLKWFEEGESPRVCLCLCVCQGWGQVPGAFACICLLSALSPQRWHHGTRLLNDGKNASRPPYKRRGEIERGGGLRGEAQAGRVILMESGWERTYRGGKIV